MTKSGAKRQARDMSRLKELGGAARKASDKEAPVLESERRATAIYEVARAVAGFLSRNNVRRVFITEHFLFVRISG